MSENGPRGKGDDRRSGRPDRRDHGSREGNKKFGERRGAPGRNGKFERDRRGRDGRDRDSFERRGARRQYDDRPGRKRDERRDDFRRGDRRSFDRRDERRGPDKRRDERGQRSAQDRPSRNGGTRPPKRDDVAARELLSAPELPDSVSFSDLDIEARRELRSLPKDLAERVGRHLVAAGMLLDEDPEAALAHARYAKAKASRIAVVREAVGLAAYHAGEWAEALAELRAARRLGVGAWVAGVGSGEVSASPSWGAPKREKSCTEDPVVGGPGHGGRRRARTSGAPRTARCGSGAPVRPADPAVLRPPAPPGRSSRAAPRGRPYTCPR